MACFTGGAGSLHRKGRRVTLGRGGCFTVGVLEVGRRKKQNCGKDWARLVVGYNGFAAERAQRWHRGRKRTDDSDADFGIIQRVNNAVGTAAIRNKLERPCGAFGDWEK